MKKIISKIFRNKITISFAVVKLLFDIVLYNIATLIAVFMRFDFKINTSYLHIDDNLGIIENVIFVIFAVIFRLPLQSYEFTSIEEVSDVFLTLFLVKAVSYPLYYLFGKGVSFSRGAYFISFIIAFLLFIGFRISYRIFIEWRKRNEKGSKKGAKKVVIVGAGNAGEQILREILRNPQLHYKVVGFLDDDPSKKRTTIHGVPVLGEISRVKSIVKEYSVDIVIYAISSVSKELLQRVVSLLSDTQCEIKTLPAIWEIVSGKVTISSIKNVDLEDLLPRASIRMDNSVVEEYIKNRVVLITGAGGSIGSEITRQVANFMPTEIILLGRGENRIFEIERELIEKKNFTKVVPIICDIRNREKVFKVFEEHRPQVVFHAAAHKHVPLMEKNPDEAILNNVFGTKNVLDASVVFKVERFINISTDKAVNPVNIMGATKRVTEIMLQYYADDGFDTKFASVRFGNVLGSAGSVVEVFKKQIKETRTLTVTDPEMERYFMLIPEAVELVLQAGSMGNKGEIFVLKMGEPVNILEFAKNFVKLSGFELGRDVTIKIIGNRGNEKLKEELWSEKEAVEQTKNPYILKVVDKATRMEKYMFFEKLDELETAAKSFDSEKMKSILKEIIPEYKG